jgi:hypothetical protein
VRNAFLEFVLAKGVIPGGAPQDFQGLARAPREPIGAIAMRNHMMSAQDVGSVLERQRRHHRPFGELSVELGLLSRMQLDILLGVQRLQSSATIAEALILSGLCEAAEIIPRLGAFLAEHANADFANRGSEASPVG